MNRPKMWSDTHFRPDRGIVVPFDAVRLHDRIDEVGRAQDALCKKLNAQGECFSKQGEYDQELLSHIRCSFLLKNSTVAKEHCQNSLNIFRCWVSLGLFLIVSSLLLLRNKEAASGDDLC